MRVHNTFLLLAVITAVSPAFALGSDYGHVEDANRCFDMTLLVDVRIADCTKVLQAGVLQKKDALAVVLQLGISYMEKRDYAHAIPAFNTVINHSAKPPWQAYAARGNAYEFMKQDDTALADYNSAIGIAPNDPEPIRIRGVYYKNLQQFPKAVDDLSHAIQLDSKNPVYFAERAQAFYGMSNKDAAIADSKNALALNTSNQLDPQLLGFVQNMLGQNANSSQDEPH